MVKKITVGFMIQEFTDEGVFIRQEFICGDQVDYENEEGESIEPKNFYEQYNYQGVKR